MIGRIFRVVLVWLLVTAGGWGPSLEAQEVLEAQEAQDGQVPPAPPASEANEEEVEEAVGDPEASPAVFIPTEEISEDAAVPFPVNI